MGISLEQVVFAVCCLLSIGSAIGVVASRNPINSALFLILNLLTVAAMFAAMNAHFLAVAQVIVYAGAIMVLFLFVIMLLNVKTELPASPWLLGGAIVGSGTLGVAILKAIQGFGAAHGVDASAPEGTVKAVGLELYTRYVFPFEVASLLIIAAIVGAVMLAQKVRKGGTH